MVKRTTLDGLKILSPLGDLRTEDAAGLHWEDFYWKDWEGDIRFAAPRNVSEGGEQRLLFELRDRYVAQYPVLKLLHHVPNGGYHPEKLNRRTGRSYSLEAQRLKALGLTPGIPDVGLPVPRLGFGGLYMEFKRPYADLEPHQVEICEELVLAGNLVARVHRGLLGWALVVRYLGLPDALIGGL